jgi:hypothetical protein
MDSRFKTREEWLQAAVDGLRPYFMGQNLQIPQVVHVSIGWPSRGGTSTGRRVFGQCWDAVVSADKNHHIFISPLLKELVKPERGDTILNVLTHELVHATVGVEAKHGPRFGKACRLLGFEGKATSNHPGPVLEAKLFSLAETLGPLPHPALTLEEKIVKRQQGRMLKAQCEQCGYIIRTTASWLKKAGPPICPCNQLPMFAQVPKEDQEDEERD